MIIRAMVESDLENVVKIEKESYINPWTLENFLADLEQEVAYNFVVEYQNKVIGYGGFYLLFEEASITKLTVDPSYRRQGVGQILLNDLINRIIKAGCQKVYLEVRISNHPAINLYSKNQFIKTHIRSNYYSNKEDALVMERRF